MKILLFRVLAIFAIFMTPTFAQVKPESFLRQFGYLKEKTGNHRTDSVTPEELHQAILNYQNFNGLPQTGMMDDVTTKKMMSPRCGVKDNAGNGEMAEYKTVNKWQKNLLTWKINKFSRTSRLSPSEQKRAIRRGLNRWSEVTPLEFRETRGKPTLDISFERGNHGDGYSFDGRGQVLAHAFYPQKGDTHFDDDEEWVSGDQSGTDLETVAAHEFGHALGLEHSNHPSSLMAPYYQKFPSDFKLHREDVAGIQRLYGKKPTRRILPTIPPPMDTGFCNQSYRSIDAAMRISGNDFVFVDKYDVIDGRNGQKMAIQRLFPGGPDIVQAAVYSKQNKKAYLFKDDSVWIFTLIWDGQFILMNNSPKKLFNKWVQKPETAMRLDIYGKEAISLIKNGYFVEFLLSDETLATLASPTDLFFMNIPSKIDASISSDRGVHFIVKNKAYYMPVTFLTVEKEGKPVISAFKTCRN